MHRWIIAISLAAFSPLILAISGGYNSKGGAVNTAVRPSASDPLAGVVYLSSTSSACTGSMLTPTIVLTAGHCAGAAGAARAIQYGTSGSYSGQVNIPITNFIAYPGFNTGSRAVQPNDIGIAFLASPMPSTVQTYSLASYTSYSQIAGAGVVFAGYGVVVTGNEPGYRSSRSTYIFNGQSVIVPQLRSGLNRIEQVSNNGKTFLTDFDGPGINAFGTAGYGPQEVGTTQGDSGSAVFYNPGIAFDLACADNGPNYFGCNLSPKLTTPDYFVLGVTSFSRYSPSCGTGDYACFNRFGTSDGYTFIGPYIPWIESVTGGAVNTSMLSNADVPPDNLAGTSSFAFNPSDFEKPDLPPAIPPALAVPEPSTVALTAIGLAGMALLRRRQVRRRE